MFQWNTLDNLKNEEVEREVEEGWEVVNEEWVEKEQQEEKSMSWHEKTESRIEEYEVENIYEKRKRMQSEDDLILDETSNSIICLDINIQHEIFNKSCP